MFAAGRDPVGQDGAVEAIEKSVRIGGIVRDAQELALATKPFSSGGDDLLDRLSRLILPH